MLSTTYVQILLLGPVLSSKLKSYIPSLSKLVTCSSLDSHLWNSEYHAVHWRDLHRMDIQGDLFGHGIVFVNCYFEVAFQYLRLILKWSWK